MKNQPHLLKVFQETTGKTKIVQKPVVDSQRQDVAMFGYQPSRVTEYARG